MAEEKPKVKPLKLKKDQGDVGKLETLKPVLKRPSFTETPERKQQGTPERKDKENSDRKDKGLIKDRDPLKSGNKEPVRSSIGKNLVKVSKELTKGNGKEQEGKVLSRDGKMSVKEEGRVLNKEGRVPIKEEGKPSSKEGKVLAKEEGRPLSKEGKLLVKEERGVNGKDFGKSVAKDLGKANGKEQGKSVGKELGKVYGKDIGGVRDLIKVRDEVEIRERDRERDREREKEKGKSPVVKTMKPGSVTKTTPKSSNAGASSSVGQPAKKKVIMTTKTTVTTTKTVKEEKKEKKVYSLPGQRHDPPEERDALRIFYSTLREQMPGSEMAEIWLMEHGLLSHDVAKKAFERKQKRVHTLKNGTPSKASSPSRLSNGSPVVKKLSVSNGKSKDVGTTSKGKKKREVSSDSDDDFLQKPVKKLKT